ncbi:MAG: 4-hydroxy-tetrahydrodipicolinate synthase [Firmicutes bacterium]|nr:4-hydroxy-tetrahydrodipicolinate synthase [Bacillota bacterium]
MILFKGAATALVTPFSEGKVDYNSLENLIEWQINEGIDALVSCGTTGEASTLSDEEQKSVVKFTVEKVNGRIPVIAGAGSNNTAHAVEMSKTLADAGADGLLIVTPYYNKCSDSGLIKHYETIADAVDIPIIAYSVAGRTGVNISPKVVSEIAQHKNICGIKEASGNIAQVVEISRYISDDFSMYSGNDESTIPLMSMGGLGVITTTGNIIPKDMQRMTNAYLNGDIEEARRMQIGMKHLIDAMFCEVNPIPIKAALNIMGKIRREYRLPLCEPDNKSLYTIMCALREYGVIDESI